jgi:glycerol-3-phosphate acyltransferase PlsY
MPRPTPSVAAIRQGPTPGGPNGRSRADLAWLAVPVGFGAAAVPFANVAAKFWRGVDLRSVGTGTVSGTGLYQVAGFGPLAVAGVFEVAKGTVGPLLAGRDHPKVAAMAAGGAVVAHNWSPLLGGAGGRGLSPAIGALGVIAPWGSALLLAGMAAGRLGRQTALGSLVAELAVIPAARRLHGGDAAWAAAAVVAPMLVKRVTGNAVRRPTSPAVYAWRILFDRDSRHVDGAVPFARPAARAVTRARRDRRLVRLGAAS